MMAQIIKNPCSYSTQTECKAACASSAAQPAARQRPTAPHGLPALCAMLRNVAKRSFGQTQTLAQSAMQSRTRNAQVLFLLIISPGYHCRRHASMRQALLQHRPLDTREVCPNIHRSALLLQGRCMAGAARSPRSGGLSQVLTLVSWLWKNGRECSSE